MGTYECQWIKLYTLKMCSLLNVEYSSIELFLKNILKGQFFHQIVGYYFQ